MKPNERYQRGLLATRLVVILVGAAALGGCGGQPKGEAGAAGGAVTSANLADKVEQARTPADHEALARYYDERARSEQTESQSERAAQGRYERRWNPDSHPMGRQAREHFGQMIEGHEAEAGRAREMAEWHRQMSKESATGREGRE